MLKVTKFGGSSMADAGQYQKVRDILLSDPARKVVVVSAAGKRDKNDHKITDLLYLCHAHIQYGVDCTGVFDMITSRYLEIRDALGIQLDLETEAGEYSYPAVIAKGNRLFITYTHRRTNVAFWELELNDE